MSEEKSLIVQSILAARDKQPYVQIMLDGKSAQFTPEEARAFGLQLIAAACASEADAAIYRFAETVSPTDDLMAGMLVQDFRKVRLDSERNPARATWDEV